MKDLITTTIGICIGLMLGMLIHDSSNSCAKSTKLEIYTLKNIYYINDLTVTNELNDDIFTFENKKSLFQYISGITVSDNKEHDCLKVTKKKRKYRIKTSVKTQSKYESKEQSITLLT
tara:strand:+ start:3165 stop:3518 length:354 start_codon:yes stop_codon:yes gene_type:complete